MRLLIILIAAFLLFAFPKDAFAVTVTINNHPSTVSNYDSFTINVSVSGAETGKNYLKVQLYKEGTTVYFGETYNGSVWYREADKTQYFPIDITSGTVWTGDIQVKMGTPSLSEYPGPGAYKMRIQRYTSSGSAGSEDENASAVPLTLSAALPTSTPVPTAAPTTAPVSTATPTSKPANTPTPTPATVNTPTPTKKPTPTPTTDPVKAAQAATMAAAMMSAQNQAPQKEVKSAQDSVDLGGSLSDLDKKETAYNWGKLLILMGAVLVTCACGILVYNNYLKDKLEEMRSQP